MILTDKILPQPNGVVNQIFLRFVDKKTGLFLYNPHKERKKQKKTENSQTIPASLRAKKKSSKKLK